MAADILLGVVLGAHGLKGEVKVRTFTETPERLAAYGPVHDAKGQVHAVVHIKAVDAVSAIAQFDQIRNRDAAERLKGSELFVARSALPQTEAEEFYHADLVGLRVEDSEGRLIGHIRGIHNFGAGDVVDIERTDGSDALLPFNRQFVPEVEIATGRIVILPPEEVEARSAGRPIRGDVE
jgi:16S rRNA processing protein RimM